MILEKGGSVFDKNRVNQIRKGLTDTQERENKLM